MEYQIITKIEYDGAGGMEHTTVGYCVDTSLCSIIITNYENTLGTFITDNLNDLTSGAVSIYDFFSITPYVYSITQDSTSINGMDLINVTNINQL